MSDLTIEEENERILFFPNGDVNIPLLESLLLESNTYASTKKIVCLRRVRISADDALYPEYVLRTQRLSIVELAKLYESYTGTTFVPQEACFSLESKFVFVYNSRTGTSGVYDMGS